MENPMNEEKVIKKKVMKKIDKDVEDEYMKVKNKTLNPWIVAVNKTRLENPDISYKEALILTKTTYVSKEQKKIIKKSKESKKSKQEEDTL